MNIRLTLRVLGGLLVFMALALLVPISASLLFAREGQWHDGACWAFVCSALITLAVGGSLFRGVRSQGEISHREGFGIVTLGWLAFGVFGALPYVFSGVLGHPVEAFFESMSGFSTTGATVIRDLGTVPESVLLWRALTQWLGGMGIIVLSLAILPFLGVSGMQLFEAEVPGPTADRLSPRIQDTAKVLWGVYVALTAAELALLWAGGMTFFDALCHAFTTMATGGFSTENSSLAAYPSAFLHMVVLVFMFLAGVNFTLHYYLLRGEFKRLWRSAEFRWYLGITVAATLGLTLLNVRGQGASFTTLKDAAFQAVSIMTTTGFITADYEQWPAASQYILVALMFIGGCAGSTAGGMKVVRIGLVTKQACLQISQLIHPRQVRVLKLDGKPVPRHIIESIGSFVALYCAVFLLASMIMAGLGLDLVSAGASVVACLGNVGPGVGSVGPMDNFADVPTLGQLVLAICMLVGRLELFTVLVLFYPSFWRK